MATRGGTDVEQVVYTARLDLPTGAPAVGFGRTAARLLLLGWGVTDDDLIDRVELVTSELVANAVRHAGGPSALEITLDHRSVTAAVVDSNPQRPTPRSATDHDGGRGLPIIQATATRWGWDPAPGGKRVWVRIDPVADHIP